MSSKPHQSQEFNFVGDQFFGNFSGIIFREQLLYDHIARITFCKYKAKQSWLDWLVLKHIL